MAPARHSLSRLPIARLAPPRLVPPLLRRILLVNLVPLALLLATVLFLDRYQDGLLDAEVATLREQARIDANALGESAVRQTQPDPILNPDLARPLLRRLTEPTPNAEARLYTPDGALIADSRTREGPGGAVQTEPLPPPAVRGTLQGLVGRAYDHLLRLLPHRRAAGSGAGLPFSEGAGFDWQADVKNETGRDGKPVAPVPPYIRRANDGRLLVTVAEPVMRDGRVVGVVQLTREAREVDDSLLAVRLSILNLFGLALALTVIMSWYLFRTIARPILRLAQAARMLQQGRGRGAGPGSGSGRADGGVPPALLARRDEIGVLAVSLQESSAALWARMDAIERFAADVSHEIKNPLSSIRSAIETLRRVEDPERQRKLLAIIADDVVRLDRLITDISDASRVDAELSRARVAPVDLAPILATLAEIHESTREGDAPRLELEAPAEGLRVSGVESRLVQVLRNLIANAISFSPPEGTVRLRARAEAGTVEVAVEDEGPGIPEGKLENVFERFYSERPAGERFGRHSGLGLSITRQIVEQLGGAVTAENRRDADGKVLGARFVVRLPGVGMHG